MKFMPAIDISIYEHQIRNGQIKLQTGQWVICGDSSKKSRFVRASRTTIYVVHPHGNGIKTERFKHAIKCWQDKNTTDTDYKGVK